ADAEPEQEDERTEGAPSARVAWSGGGVERGGVCGRGRSCGDGGGAEPLCRLGGACVDAVQSGRRRGPFGAIQRSPPRRSWVCLGLLRDDRGQPRVID